MKLFIPLALFATFAAPAAAEEPGWKAGTAKAIITPERPLWMAGYGGRTEPADGKLHDLWVKALVLEDAHRNRVVLISTDLLGIPKGIYDKTCCDLKRKFDLERSRIMLNSSHTHCGPVLSDALYDIYPLDDKQRAMIDDYSEKLQETIVDTVERALTGLQPATLYRGQGVTRFAVNRRENPAAKVPELREAGALKGPVDHSVPVLAVRSADGKLMAVVFGYACHNTTLSFQKWCGDYAGFAQIELEEKYPNAAAMFFMGCGADQNPLPRRSVELCERYGRMLAGAVDDVLRRPMKPIEPRLRTAFEFVCLKLGPHPTKAELEALAIGKDYRARWAKRLLGEMKQRAKWADAYPYPVQVWKLGDEQLWIALGGEVVVDYSLRFKKEIDASAWVTGYANDVMAYIPSLRVLKEGGYEGATSMMVYGLPAHRWSESVEDQIVESVQKLVSYVND